MNLQQQIAHIQHIFGLRNDRCMREIPQRLAFLMAGINQLEKICQHRRVDDYERWLASVFARWSVTITMFTGEQSVAKIASKYRLNCSYCHAAPCVCPPTNRPDPKYSNPNPIQFDWSVKEWQEHLFKLYGVRNNERGLDHALLKLYSEAAESLSEWLLASTAPSFEPFDWAKINEDIIFELCDVFARLCAVASVLKIDLEAAILKQYSSGCTVCKNMPCACVTEDYFRANTSFI